MIILFWIAFSVAVGMFAYIHRNRSGFGWFLLALIISPLLAGIFVAILKPLLFESECAEAAVPFEQLPAAEQARLAKLRDDLRKRRV